MTWWENNINNSKYQHNNTWFNHLLKPSNVNDVINPISLGMEPVRVFWSNAFGNKMKKSIIMTWWEKNIDNSKWQHNNTWFNHLPNIRYLSDVNNPISLGIEPIRLSPAESDRKLWKRRDLYEKIYKILQNNSRITHWSLTQIQIFYSSLITYDARPNTLSCCTYP
jgi:hypothetical protein